MDDDKKAKVISLFKEAINPDNKGVSPLSVTINAGNGDGNGIGNTIIKTERVTHKTVATPKPGEEHITEDQKLALVTLRDEWIKLHNSIKKRPLGFGAAWLRINKAASATSYHLIRIEKFETAVAFVRTEIARLRGMASAPAKDKQWRASRIGAIKARCTNQLGNPEAYKPYIKKNFGAESLSALATDELQRTYTYIMGKKAPK